MNNKDTRASEKWREKIKEWQGIDLSGNKIQPEPHCETCHKIIADLESLEAENADLRVKLEKALTRERELSLAYERMRGVLIEINRNLGLIMTAENRGFGIAYIEGLSESICGNIDEELSNPRCGEKHNEEMHEHEYDEPYKNYLFWCSEGCGFVDQHHRCEQWSSLTYIPPELAEALRQIRAKL